MSLWFYFAQEDGDPPTQTCWRGFNELRRRSSVVLRQRCFSLGPIEFFYGRTEVDMELVWEWSSRSLPQ